MSQRCAVLTPVHCWQPLTDILYTVTPEATPSSILYYTNDVMLYGAAVAAVVFTLTRKDSWERAAVGEWRGAACPADC